MNDKNSQPDDRGPVKVKREDLPAHCPTEAMGLWNLHPRVYISLEESPQANCPYCGTQFVLLDG